MAKKTVELSTKRKVELKEMTVDEIDFCSDVTTVTLSDDGGVQNIGNMSKSRTSWLRRGIKGGDFKGKVIGADGLFSDSCIKQLSDDEKNELLPLIQDYQKLGEEKPSH